MRVTKNAFFGAAAALIRHPAGHFCGTLGAYRERRILYRGVDFAEKAERRARGAVRAVVYYRPKDRMLSTARGTYTLQG